MIVWMFIMRQRKWEKRTLHKFAFLFAFFVKNEEIYFGNDAGGRRRVDAGALVIALLW